MANTITTEQFSLRWNNFHTNLKSGFHELLRAADMVDVTLAVDGHFLQAHKVVLSICSPYFKRMFKANPCNHPIVILKDVGHENMKDILQFMYMGEVSVLRENLSAFLRTAEVLQVKGLTGDDSNDDFTQKEIKPDMDNEDENELYNQLIETTSDVEAPAQYPLPTPAQTSPLPLNTMKRQSKTPTPPQSKKTKNSDPHAKTKEPEVVPKLNSCDYTNAQSGTDIVSKTEIEEAKDLSKPAGWDGAGSNPAGPGGGSATGGGWDASSTDQGPKPEHRPPPVSLLKHGYQCEQCFKRFSRRDHLRTHEKNIHGSDAGPFKCLICEQLYKNTESLRKHISKFHFTNMNELGHKIEVKA